MKTELVINMRVNEPAEDPTKVKPIWHRTVVVSLDGSYHYVEALKEYILKFRPEKVNGETVGSIEFE